MRKIIFIVFCLCILSCGKSIYYVYDTTADKDHYSYCSLEITRKKEIIYRAASYQYWSESSPNSNLYLYLYSDKYNTDINNNHYSFVSSIADISYIKNESNPKFDHFFIDFSEKPGYSIIYIKTNKNETYGTRSDTIFSSADNNFEYLKEGRGFKEHGIKWFPPYMVKVNKLDYKKFGETIQHLNLKNPKEQK